jgi:hypothetical protein
MNATKQELFDTFCNRVLVHYEKRTVNWQLIKNTLEWFKTESDACGTGHPVETCGLTPNLAGYLIKAGYETLEEALRLSDSQLGNLPGISPRYVSELRACGRRYGVFTPSVKS